MKITFWDFENKVMIIQGFTGKYTVHYLRKTCTCQDHTNRKRDCKHIRYALEQANQVGNDWQTSIEPVKEAAL